MAGIPWLVAPLVGLWSGRNWAWWLTAATAAGLVALGLMAHFAVFPDLLAAEAGRLDWFVGYPLRIALGSLVVLALLCCAADPALAAALLSPAVADARLSGSAGGHREGEAPAEPGEATAFPGSAGASPSRWQCRVESGFRHP